MTKAEFKKNNWRLTIRAAIIVAAIGMAFSGTFHFNRIECTVCWKEIASYLFSVFGFISGTGFAIGLTLPAQRDETRISKNP